VVNSSTPILVNGSTPFDTAGAKLRYHGDFNWPDLRIATVMQLCGAVLWCFTGDDYGAAIERFKGAPLIDPPLPNPWDPRIADARARPLHCRGSHHRRLAQRPAI
jgi:hypothetical protein